MGDLYKLPIEGSETQRIDLAGVGTFSLGTLEVSPSKLSLEAFGKKARVEPKIMKVLVALARDPGRVLSRDDLLELAWDGRIVGDASINRALSHLRAALRQLVDGSVQIETLPRVGYRLLVEEAPGGGEVNASTGSSVASRLKAIPLIGTLLLLGAIGLTAWFLWPGGSQMDRVNLVILPIESSSAMDEFATLGVEMQLRDSLAQGDGIIVNASGSVQQLSDEGRSPQEIARALDADFVIRGRIDFGEERSSLALKIYASGSDMEIWSDEFARPPEATAELLPQAVREIRLAIGLPADQAVALPPLTRQQLADFMLASGIVRSRNPANMPVADQMLQKLLRNNPGFVPAWIALAQAKLAMPGDSEHRRWQRAGELFDRALELDPENAQALGWRGFHSDGDVEQRLTMVQRAVQLDPGDVRIQQFKAILELASGRSGEALDTYEQMARLDPLWVRASQAHDMAIELGERDRAAVIMQNLRRIVSDPEHIALLDAAEARATGDLSEAVRILWALQASHEVSFRSTARFHLVGLRAYLGLIGESGSREMVEDEILLRVFAADLPDRAGMEAFGFDARDFWNDELMRVYAPGIYLKMGRPEVLTSFYDEFAADPDDFMGKLSNERFDFRLIAPFLALALRETGRQEEANQVLRRALQIDAEFIARGPPRMGELVRSAQLYAVAGRADDALSNLEQARSMGWPYISSWLLVFPYLGTLLDDPAFGSLQGSQRFRALAAEVEAERQRERRESFAQEAA